MSDLDLQTKKKKLFDPRTAFFDLPLIRRTLYAAVLTIVAQICIISYHDLRSLDLSAAGFNEAFNMMKVPVWTLGAFAALLALFATNHRSEQNRMSMELSILSIEATKTQNRFSNYYKHIEELENYFKRHIISDGNNPLNATYISSVVCRFNKLHSKLYPESKKQGIGFSDSVTKSVSLWIDIIISSLHQTTFSDSAELEKLLFNLDDSCSTVIEGYFDECIIFENNSRISFVNMKFPTRNIVVPEAQLGSYLRYLVERLKITYEILCFEESFDERGALRGIISHIEDVIKYVPHIAVAGSGKFNFFDSKFGEIHRRTNELNTIWMGVKERTEMIQFFVSKE